MSAAAALRAEGPFPPDVLVEVKSNPGNNQCCDCGSFDTEWASVTYGVLICLRCSGFHRSLGVSISFVRSLSLDSWTPRQVYAMRLGSNFQMQEFFRRQRISNTDIRIRYQSKAATVYRSTLSEAVEKGWEADWEKRKARKAAGGGGGSSSSTRRQRLKSSSLVSPPRRHSSFSGLGASNGAGGGGGGGTGGGERGGGGSGEEGRRSESSGRHHHHHQQSSSNTKQELPPPPPSPSAAAEEEKEEFVEVTVEGEESIGISIQKDLPTGHARVYRVALSGPAYRAGVQTGDTLMGLGHRRLEEYDDLMALLPNMGRPLRLVFRRGRKGGEGGGRRRVTDGGRGQDGCLIPAPSQLRNAMSDFGRHPTHSTANSSITRERSSNREPSAAEIQQQQRQQQQQQQRGGGNEVGLRYAPLPLPRRRRASSASVLISRSRSSSSSSSSSSSRRRSRQVTVQASVSGSSTSSRSSSSTCSSSSSSCSRDSGDDLSLSEEENEEGLARGKERRKERRKEKGKERRKEKGKEGSDSTDLYEDRFRSLTCGEEEAAIALSAATTTVAAAAAPASSVESGNDGRNLNRAMQSTTRSTSSTTSSSNSIFTRSSVSSERTGGVHMSKGGREEGVVGNEEQKKKEAAQEPGRAQEKAVAAEPVEGMVNKEEKEGEEDGGSRASLSLRPSASFMLPVERLAVLCVEGQEEEGDGKEGGRGREGGEATSSTATASSRTPVDKREGGDATSAAVAVVAAAAVEVATQSTKQDDEETREEGVVEVPTPGLVSETLSVPQPMESATEPWSSSSSLPPPPPPPPSPPLPPSPSFPPPPPPQALAKGGRVFVRPEGGVGRWRSAIIIRFHKTRSPVNGKHLLKVRYRDGTLEEYVDNDDIALTRGGASGVAVTAGGGGGAAAAEVGETMTPSHSSSFVALSSDSSSSSPPLSHRHHQQPQQQQQHPPSPRKGAFEGPSSSHASPSSSFHPAFSPRDRQQELARKYSAAVDRPSFPSSSSSPPPSSPPWPATGPRSSSQPLHHPQQQHHHHQQQQQQQHQAPREYTVVFQEGPLGFTLSKVEGGRAIVTNVAPAGQAVLRGVRLGDAVVSLDHQQLTLYDSIMARFPFLPRPLVVGFKKKMEGLGNEGARKGGREGGFMEGGKAVAVGVGSVEGGKAFAGGFGKSMRVLQRGTNAILASSSSSGSSSSSSRPVGGGCGLTTKICLRDQPGTGEFDTFFAEGPLGMRLEEMAVTSREGGLRYVCQVLQVTPGGAAEKEGVMDGCVVVGVNGERFISHAHTVATLRHGKRPVVVRFRMHR